MAGRGRKFNFFGVFKSKAGAKRKEHSAQCGGKCFILPRKVRGRKRYVVLKKR